MSKELSIYKVAEILGCSTKTVRNYIRKGKLNAFKLPTPKGYEYRFDENEVSKFSREGNARKFSNWKNEGISYKELYEKVENKLEKKEYELEQAMIRIAQLENQRLMLTERAESIQQKEIEYRLKTEEQQKLLEEKEQIIQKLKAKLETLTRKKWWEFWKKPISQLLSEPSQL